MEVTFEKQQLKELIKDCIGEVISELWKEDRLEICAESQCYGEYNDYLLKIDNKTVFRFTP